MWFNKGDQNSLESGLKRPMGNELCRRLHPNDSRNPFSFTVAPQGVIVGEGPARWGLSGICFHAADGLLFAFSFSEVFVGAPEAFFEGDLRLPVKVAFGFGVVQGGAVDVALSGFIVDGGDLFA